MSHPDDDADRLEDEIDALARASADFFLPVISGIFVLRT